MLIEEKTGLMFVAIDGADSKIWVQIDIKFSFELKYKSSLTLFIFLN